MKPQQTQQVHLWVRDLIWNIIQLTNKYWIHHSQWKQINNQTKQETQMKDSHQLLKIRSLLKTYHMK